MDAKKLEPKLWLGEQFISKPHALMALTVSTHVFSIHCEGLETEVGYFNVYIHAAPRQGPPAPRSQGVISASVVVAPGQSSKNLVFSAIFVPLEEKMLVFTMFLQHQGQH